MFVLSQYILNTTGMCTTTKQISTYSIATGLILYGAVYLYILYYNEEYLSIFNKFIIYIILIDLLLSAFYYYNLYKAEAVGDEDNAEEGDEEGEEGEEEDDSDDEESDDDEDNKPDDDTMKYINSLIENANKQAKLSEVVSDAEVIESETEDVESETDEVVEVVESEVVEKEVEPEVIVKTKRKYAKKTVVS